MEDHGMIVWSSSYLSQSALILLDNRILELDSSRLDDLLLFLLLVILGSLRESSLTTSFSVSLQTGLDNGLNEMVGTEDFTSLDILDHPVGESGSWGAVSIIAPMCNLRYILVNVSRGLKDIMKGHDSGVKLGHILLNDKVLPPHVQNVRLQSRSRWTIVVKTGNTYRCIS
jgi:hypothetical protein